MFCRSRAIFAIDRKAALDLPAVVADDQYFFTATAQAIHVHRICDASSE